MSSRGELHMSAAKQVLRHRIGSIDLPIIGKKGQFQLQAYTDAPLAANPGDRNTYLCRASRSSWGEMAISFGAKMQTLTAQSKGETELMAVSYGMKEAVYLSNLLGDLGFKSFNTVPVDCDGARARSDVANRPYSSRNTHVAERLLLYTKSGRITLHHVPAGAVPVSPGTKHLSNCSFRSIMQKIKDASCRALSSFIQGFPLYGFD